MRKQAVSEDSWFSQLISFLNQKENAKPAAAFFQEQMGKERTQRMEQLFSLGQKPTFQYFVDGKKRKLKFTYRWKNVPPNFSYPLNINVNGNYQKIIPTTAWQELTFRGVAPKNILMPKDQTWYTIKEAVVPKYGQ